MAVPRRSAAAGLPVLSARIPRLGGPGHRGVLEGLGRIAGDGEPAPALGARLGVIGGDIAAHAVLGATVADDHLALVDTRGARDRVRPRAVDDGVLRPHHPTGGGVEGDQAAVVGGDEHLALVDGHAAVDHVAAALVARLARHVGIVDPQPLARADVDGVHHAPRGADVHDAVHHHRRGLHPARGLEVVGPHQAERLDVVRVDLGEPAESRLRVVQAMRRPVARGTRVGADAGVVDLGGRGADALGRDPARPTLREGALRTNTTDQHGERDRGESQPGRRTLHGFPPFTTLHRAQDLRIALRVTLGEVAGERRGEPFAGPA